MSDKKDKRGEYAFVGCMFIGVGIGYLVGIFFGWGIDWYGRWFFK